MLKINQYIKISHFYFVAVYKVRLQVLRWVAMVYDNKQELVPDEGYFKKCKNILHLCVSMVYSGHSKFFFLYSCREGIYDSD